MHRLIQAVTLHQLTPDQHNHSRQTAAELILAALPDDPGTIDAWPAYRALLPHARSVLPPGSPGLTVGALGADLQQYGERRSAAADDDGVEGYALVVCTAGVTGFPEGR
ncbi:hypothetical protein HD597_012950 [Nonomuraea thailandensis]|uniref:Uncharacterized protein n=1 Tax=Nonomuraea thailandensis TaxID=1188745 RepID=A0A9X2KD87_9ACTN|nr:hypothetical protein [Nonomuraea thailandensis]MCP2365846.1 hypothetical protein [Nonomuraea thailandensis]